MNRFQIELLKQALENYRESGKAIGVTLGKGGDEIFYYSNALDLLIEQEYAVPTSDNYDPDVVAPRVSYELTEKGLNYVLTNLAR